MNETSHANLPDLKEVLNYLEESGRKIKKTKLYADVKKGLLRRQKDLSFKPRDVDRYASSLPMAGTPDAVAERATERLRRKEEEEIRRLTALADKEEFLQKVRQGQYVPKEQVHLELAARAVTLASGLKSAIEAQGLDLVALAGGDPKKSQTLLARLESLLDDAMNEYSREMEFEVLFVEAETENATGAEL